MTTLELLQFQTESMPRPLDDIDFIAEQHALEQVGERAQYIEREKAAEVRAIFDKLNRQFARRRISDTTYVGKAAYEQVVFGTRTPDCGALDEVFIQESTYIGWGSKDASETRYEVQLFEGDGSRRTVVLESDGSMSFWYEAEGQRSALGEDGANAAMFDLVMRAETAVGTYEMRQEAAIAEGLDPSTYTDMADGDALLKMQRLGYKQQRRAVWE